MKDTVFENTLEYLSGDLRRMISFLPDFVTNNLIATGELCYLDVCDMEIDIWKQLIYHKNKWISKTMKTFLDFVKEREFSATE